MRKTQRKDQRRNERKWSDTHGWSEYFEMWHWTHSQFAFVFNIDVDIDIDTSDPPVADLPWFYHFMHFIT